MILTKENILPYLRDVYPAFDQSVPVDVHVLGESEEDSVGLINHIFRVRTPNTSLIIKQGQPNIRSAEGFEYLLPTTRNHLEAQSLRLRQAIVPQYIPQLYLEDPEHHIMVMEDVSYLPSCRLALTQGSAIPNLGLRCGDFMASIAFFTSEFYLPRTTFRTLGQRFGNHEMRRVMEEWSFFRRSPHPPCPETLHLEPELQSQEIRSRIYLLRQHYMSHAEALIHSDLHTGNLFASPQELKVIDMEYTFPGPCAYDPGYLLSSLLSLYCASFWLPLPHAPSARAHQQYLLETMEELLVHYRRIFLELWQDHAKAEYRACPAYAHKFLDEIFPDAVGYAAVISITLSMRGPEISEFQAIAQPGQRQQAIELYYAIAQTLLLSYPHIRTPEQLLQAIGACTQRYFAR